MLSLITATLLISRLPEVPAELVPAGDGCSPSVYRVLDDQRRNILSVLEEDEDPLCDDLLPPQGGWFRFLSAPGGEPALLATECPGPGVCGTRSPAWLDTSSLTSSSSSPNTTRGEVCVSWSWPGSTDCCLYTLPVTIKLCPGFTSYFLQPTAACHVAYCSHTARTGGEISDDTPDLTSLCLLLIADKIPTGATGLAFLEEMMEPSLDYNSHYHYAQTDSHLAQSPGLPTIKVTMENNKILFSCQAPDPLLISHKR